MGHAGMTHPRRMARMVSASPIGPGGERGTGQRDRQVRGKVRAERPRAADPAVLDRAVP